MSKYLVTGSAGFIGSHVTRALLERGDEVVGIDNLNDYYSVELKASRNEILAKYPNYEFHKQDIAEREGLYKVLDATQPSRVCHLAAQAGIRYSLTHPFVYERSNVQGFLNLIEWAKDNLENFVFASSSSVYGGNEKIPFSEDDPVERPISLYAATKKSNELMAYVYHHLYEFPITGLRFFTVYGPWGRPDMAYYKFANKIVRGEVINVYGHGKMSRDYTYIDDMVPSVLTAVDTPREYGIYNLGGNKPIELLYFISLLEQELGLDADKNLMEIQPGEVRVTYADIEKAKRDLGFEPRMSIEEGVKRFVEWFKEYHGIK